MNQLVVIYGSMTIILFVTKRRYKPSSSPFVILKSCSCSDGRVPSLSPVLRHSSLSSSHLGHLSRTCCMVSSSLHIGQNGLSTSGTLFLCREARNPIFPVRSCTAIADWCFLTRYEFGLFWR